ncbi:hypothetical protein, variant [Blastomyces dermatitidis ATCC 18188]|uniref:Uncharacterized protein n=1 Tax=Ajellomyces dermatitidis (strain ATCC 18188 / CBS 674.68) TaxID=653446 RepID=F2T3Y1_AJEDA|nr:hypothetical protein BDDG_00577 [Blastomyces dermatitidis ATCC 18188]KMW66539.1 hypothetical protein, variant [Blastomyces dermatitidis ATCC 18188]
MEAGPCIDTLSYISPAKTGGKQHKIHLRTRKLWPTSPIMNDTRTDSFFPIVTILCRNHDDYNPWETKDLSDVAKEKRIIRWRRVSKYAEVVALLIAAAQKQAQRLPDNH